MPTGERKDPYRGYNFKLEIDGINRNGFRECSGLDATSDPIDYREGDEKVYCTGCYTGKYPTNIVDVEDITPAMAAGD